MADESNNKKPRFKSDASYIGGRWDAAACAGWVANDEAFHKEQARIKATPDSKKRRAWIRANAKREHAELAAWHKRCDDIAKEIQGEDYDPSIYQDDDEYRPK
ncbi:MAG: hypothetical protein LBR11_08220 [Deltaproteobacteria bacterium]|jgi:hypothetical protein|nr:hypothetical protein [Deltaproteobacteria bacterium]